MQWSNKGVEVRIEKELFVPTEFYLLRHWAKLLEKEQKGTVLVYLILQTGIVREEASPKYGRADLSVQDIAEMMGSSRPLTYRALDTLENFGFISRKKVGDKLQIIVLAVPVIEADREVFEDEQIFAVAKAEKLDLQTDVSKWKTPDLAKHWRIVYSAMVWETKHMNDDYGFPAPKEMGLMKKLLLEHGAERVKLAIDFFMDNYNSFIDSYPTISAFYGYRRSVFPEQKLGVPAKRGQWKKDTIEGFKEKAVRGW